MGTNDEDPTLFDDFDDEGRYEPGSEDITSHYHGDNPNSDAAFESCKAKNRKRVLQFAQIVRDLGRACCREVRREALRRGWDGFDILRTVSARQSEAERAGLIVVLGREPKGEGGAMVNVYGPAPSGHVPKPKRTAVRKTRPKPARKKLTERDIALIAKIRAAGRVGYTCWELSDGDPEVVAQYLDGQPWGPVSAQLNQLMASDFLIKTNRNRKTGTGNYSAIIIHPDFATEAERDFHGVDKDPNGSDAGPACQ